MKLIKAIWILLAAAMLASCGGGGDAGTSPFNPNGGGGGGSAAVADIVLTLSATQVPNIVSSKVTVTATAIDAARNALANVPVTISADADAIVTAGSSATGDNGSLTATMSIGSNRSNRLITVSAVSGSISRSATTTRPPRPRASTGISTP